jgi:hypothetical protein
MLAQWLIFGVACVPEYVLADFMKFGLSEEADG